MDRHNARSRQSAPHSRYLCCVTRQAAPQLRTTTSEREAMKQSSLQVGVDVPWVTSWTAEPVLGIQPCQTVSGRPALVQAQCAGFGKPEYSKNHLVRQRLTVRKMLCPMCGEPTHAGDRVTQLAKPTTAGALRARGLAGGLGANISDGEVLIDAGSIAPLHRRCSDLSLKHCPHLRAAPVEVQSFPDRWLILPLLIEADTTPSPGHALLRQPPRPIAVVTFLQICGWP